MCPLHSRLMDMQPIEEINSKIKQKRNAIYLIAFLFLLFQLKIISKSEQHVL